MQFFKYHALGNDYLVLESNDIQRPLTPEVIFQICAPHFGIGADGILVRQPDPEPGRFEVQIFNSGGSEAEKSGNGLRIFARYLWDLKLVGEDPFQVNTQGGTVTCQLSQQGKTVAVDMGHVTFNSYDIPVTGPPREVLQETMNISGRKFEFSAASVGNPHCVIPVDEVSEEETRTFGPLIETEARFPNLTNVQFMQVLNRNNIRIEIWERGVGYTLASGTSSCAAAAVARRLDLCDQEVTVAMPGGELEVVVDDNYAVHMTGPVVKVAEGELCNEIYECDALLYQPHLQREEETSAN